MDISHEVRLFVVIIKNKSKYFKKDEKYTIEVLSFDADEAGEACDLKNEFSF